MCPCAATTRCARKAPPPRGSATSTSWQIEGQADPCENTGVVGLDLWIRAQSIELGVVDLGDAIAQRRGHRESGAHRPFAERMKVESHRAALEIPVEGRRSVGGAGDDDRLSDLAAEAIVVDAPAEADSSLPLGRQEVRGAELEGVAVDVDLGAALDVIEP